MDQYLGQSIPKLGFGLMRLPTKDGAIDIPQTCEMVDMFMKKGFVYFDTAYGYGNGASEEAAKKALVDRYPREKFMLATKLPAWLGAKTAEEAKAMFETSLKRTGAGYFDFYLLHNLGGDRTKVFDDFGIWEFLQEKKQAGLIRHLGFSFHDKAEVLDEILTAHPEMEFVQLQINYVDWESESVESRKCYEVARKHGKPVIIMEPVKGGNLATPPQQIEQIMKNHAPDKSCSSWALRFAASLEGLVCVLSGMSNVEQMADNLTTMENFQPLTEDEHAVLDEVCAAFKAIPTIPCTACAYCVKNCPAQVAIPAAFQAYNKYLTYNSLASARSGYNWATSKPDANKAGACIGCGQCEEVCPQHISIREELKKVAATLD